MALLDERDSLLERLAHLEADQHHGEAPAAEGGHGDVLALRQRLLGRDQPHVVQLVDQRLGRLDSDLVLNRRSPSSVVASHTTRWREQAEEGEGGWLERIN